LIFIVSGLASSTQEKNLELGFTARVFWKITENGKRLLFAIFSYPNMSVNYELKTTELTIDELKQFLITEKTLHLKVERVRIGNGREPCSCAGGSGFCPAV
jgi:hypothetical protein